jgi:hypothetical protein
MDPPLHSRSLNAPGMLTATGETPPPWNPLQGGTLGMDTEESFVESEEGVLRLRKGTGGKYKGAAARGNG